MSKLSLTPQQRKPPAAEVEAPVVAAPSPIELSVAVREVLALPALLLCELPLPAALLCLTHGGGRLALATSSVAPVVADSLAFVGPELSALVIATEHDRANWLVLGAWCERKIAEPQWRLTCIAAVGGLACSTPPRNWTWERVLRALGLRLEEVWV